RQPIFYYGTSTSTVLSSSFTREQYLFVGIFSICNAVYLVTINYPKIMKIIITGAAGFIGSKLAEKFLELDYQVVGLDDLSTGSMDNLHFLIQNPNFSIIIGDINNYNAWEDNVEKDDVIIHLAATVGVKKV